MTTEQQWLGNEPYPTSQDGPRPVAIGYYEGTTLPVYDYPPVPDSPPVITVEWIRPFPEEVLSAALEDAEGRALVEDILERKRLTNIRERFFQQMVWGSVRTDGHGNVIPREVPEYWKSLKAAALAGGGVEYTKGEM